MITKIKSIRNFAIFQDFNWDKDLRDKGNNILTFQTYNIIYGRNYSGKTTLSRIVRSLETQKMPNKYENGEFEIELDNDQTITQDELEDYTKLVRVFNQDFVRENLSFITNPDENITPFAVLGKDNVEIEQKIRVLKDELGNDEEENKTGLYLKLSLKKGIAEEKNKQKESIKKALDKKISDKALDKTNGIKYQPQIYGKQNYNTSDLNKEIQEVLANPPKALSEEEKEIKLKIIKEEVKDTIRPLDDISLDILNLNQRVKDAVTKSISSSNKIEKLVQDATLNGWVQKGKELHENNKTKCLFCENHISENRWEELERHFDEESKKLEIELDRLFQETKQFKEELKDYFNINIDSFYSNFQKQAKDIATQIKQIKEEINKDVDYILNRIQARKNSILNPQTYNEVTCKQKDLNKLKDEYENLRTQSNNYSKSLDINKEKAKKILRLNEVFKFAKDIDYQTRIQEIKKAEQEVKEANAEYENISNQVKDKQKNIQELEASMSDEKEGANAVNKYLEKFFGHPLLRLELGQDSENNRTCFQIKRDGNIAYHLSEGECSLVAFCYFMAKLKDTYTAHQKPIIYIDDPISSLDSNHIFFIYSLIDTELIKKGDYEQIFISTHNLNFLKYLKRLHFQTDKERRYFLIERFDKDKSTIKQMPKYLKDFITEFNYLFEKIYEYAHISTDTDPDVIYNFGNNARKFLELFLYYKYPNAQNKDEMNKLIKFFGDEHEASQINRITNEFSHLQAIFERGELPIDHAEIKKVAKLILRKIKERDKDQYNAFLESIDKSKKTK